MRMSYKKGGGSDMGKVATTPKEKKLAAKYGNKKTITRGDVITAAKEKAGGKRTMAMGGGMMRKEFGKGGGADTHVTKDGRTVKKGLYYYMNRAKKNKTSKPGKGSVTDKALKASAKTAKKTTKKA